MLRRDFVRRALAGAAALALFPGLARAGQAQGCYRLNRHEVHCAVGFPDTPYIEPQTCRELTWANCLAYLLRGYGMKISVASVLARMEMPAACARRDDAAILLGAAGHWRDDTGRLFLVKTQRIGDILRHSSSADDFEPLVAALKTRPLIVGQPGWSAVLTDMSYVDMPMVWMRPNRLTLRDPWTGSENLRHLSYEEMPENLFAVILDAKAL